MKKRILVVVNAAMLPLFACAAEGPKVTVGGSLDARYGAISQPQKFREHLGDNYGKRMQQNGVVNATELQFTVDGKWDAQTKYGAVVVLNADTYLDLPDDYVADKVFIHVENTSWGRFEAGSGAAVTKSMTVSAKEIAAATGGINGVQQKWINSRNADGTKFGATFIKWPEMPMRCDGITNGNKVTYYTPKFGDFSAGVSYSPDYSARGTIAALKQLKRDDDSDFNNVFDLGAQYQTKMRDVGLRLGAVAQLGRAKHDLTRRNNLSAWEMGMRIDYAGFAVAGSYADWRKSGTPKERKYGAKYGADYWTLGGAYEYRDTNMSVTYFKGKRANVFLTDALLTTTVHETGYNRNHFLSFGVDHALVPGFMPYAEVTYFKNKRHGDTQHNKGQVMIVGTKLSF